MSSENSTPSNKTSAKDLLVGLNDLEYAVETYFSEFYNDSDMQIRFSNLYIIGDLKVKLPDLHKFNISFIDCYFDAGITFEIEDCTSRLEFDSCFIKDGIGFSSGNYKESIIIRDGTPNRIVFWNGKYETVIISAFDTGVLLEAGHFNSLLIGDNRIESNGLTDLTFNLSNITGSVAVINSVIWELNIYGTIQESLKMRYTSCRIKKVGISNLIKHGDLIFDTIYWGRGNPLDDPQVTDFDEVPFIVPAFTEAQKILALKYHNCSSFEIANSNVGDTQFNNIDFSDYDEVNIYKSRLSDVLMSNVRWNNRILSNDPRNSKNFRERFYKLDKLYRHDYLAIRENYRQLKFASSKQQDYINEQHFHALEMHAYDKSLTWRKKVWTKTILKLSHLTSNFGQSIARPLASIGIVNGFLFYLLFLCGESPLKAYDFSNWESYINTFAEFLRFVNPLHKNEKELTGITFIIDLLMRICSSYFLYNLVRATRRFVR